MDPIFTADIDSSWSRESQYCHTRTFRRRHNVFHYPENELEVTQRLKSTLNDTTVLSLGLTPAGSFKHGGLRYFERQAR
jgi:hypothetical protein